MLLTLKLGGLLASNALPLQTDALSTSTARAAGIGTEYGTVMHCLVAA